MGIVNGFQNEDAERNLLAYIVTGKEKQNVINALVKDDFSDERHAQIFAVIKSMALEGKPIDIVTATDAITANTGNEQLNELLTDCVANKTCNTEFHALEYVKILEKAAKRRNLYHAFQDSINELQDETNDVDVVADKARQTLRSMITSTGNKWLPFSDVYMNTIEYIERVNNGEEKGIPSGISTLDRLTAGFHRGELTILGARPALGKSALGVIHMATAAAKANYKVAVCSCEMTDIQYGTRMISRCISFPSIKLRQGGMTDDEWTQVCNAGIAYGDCNDNIVFTFSTRYIEDLQRDVQKMADDHKIDMLVIDYAQLMDSRRKFDAEYQRIGYVTKTLKHLAIECNIAVLALAQVGRISDSKMPTMAELRGSGDIEQDADNIIFIHRPADADDEWVHEDHKANYFNAVQEKGMIYNVLNLAKQRQGATGCVIVLFDPTTQNYSAVTNEN